MKTQNLLMGLLACLCAAGCATAKPKGYSEREVQLWLKDHGVTSTVLRPKSALRDVPDRGQKGFLILLEGNPRILVVLDRDYWVLAVPKKAGESVSYMLNPKDEQSALTITINDDAPETSDVDLARDPGFTEITRQPGIIAHEKVVWRRWSDANHLYSDCTVQLPAVDAQDSKKYRVYLKIIANTPIRRKALEEHLDSIRLILWNGRDEPVAQDGVANGASPRC